MAALTADKVNVILEAQNTDFNRKTRDSANEFERGMGKIKKSADVTEKSVKQSVAGMGSSLSSLKTAILGLGLLALGKDAVSTALNFRKLEQGLATAVGGVERANEEFTFLRDLADRLGVRFSTLAEQYVGFAAAARGTNIEGERTREIFESVATAITAVGGSAEQQTRALLAIQQIISKGAVSAEELRGQLGEALPGAFQIAARAMGVTTAQLGKLLEAGSVVSDEFLPKFAAQLRKELPQSVEAADADFQRFLTTLDDTKNVIATGFMPQLTESTNELGKILKGMQADGSLTALADGIGAVAFVAGKMITGLGKGIQILQDFGDKAQAISDQLAIRSPFAKPEVLKVVRARIAQREAGINPRTGLPMGQVPTIAAPEVIPAPASPNRPNSGSGGKVETSAQRTARIRKDATEAKRVLSEFYSIVNAGNNALDAAADQAASKFDEVIQSFRELDERLLTPKGGASTLEDRTAEIDQRRQQQFEKTTAVIEAAYDREQQLIGDLKQGLAGVITGANSLGDALVNAFARAAAAQLEAGLGGAIGTGLSLAKSFFSPSAASLRAAPGNAMGGSYVAQTARGGDSSLAVLRVNNGERIDVTPSNRRAASRGGGVTVVQPMSVSFAGAVVTEKLMRDFKSYADQTAQRAGSASYRAGMAATPGALSQMQTLGNGPA